MGLVAKATCLAVRTLQRVGATGVGGLLSRFQVEDLYKLAIQASVV